MKMNKSSFLPENQGFRNKITVPPKFPLKKKVKFLYKKTFL